mgnify:CR=1 FL=1
MTKPQLIDAVAAETQQSRRAVETVINSALDQITVALKRGDKVQLTGFGTFEVRTRKARVGRNPQTKEVIQIPGRKSPAFSAGKALKDAVA